MGGYEREGVRGRVQHRLSNIDLSNYSIQFQILSGVSLANVHVHVCTGSGGGPILAQLSHVVAPAGEHPSVLQ